MGEFRPFHGFVVAGFLICFAIPPVNILKRTGQNPLWCVLCFLPVVNIALLWIFAFKDWPIDRQSQGV